MIFLILPFPSLSLYIYEDSIIFLCPQLSVTRKQLRCSESLDILQNKYALMAIEKNLEFTAIPTALCPIPSRAILQRQIIQRHTNQHNTQFLLN